MATRDSAALFLSAVLALGSALTPVSRAYAVDAGAATSKSVLEACRADTPACRAFLVAAHRAVRATLVAFDPRHPLGRCRAPASPAASGDGKYERLYAFMKEHLVARLEAVRHPEHPAIFEYARMLDRRTSRVLALCD